MRVKQEISDEIWYEYDQISNMLIDEATKAVDGLFKHTKKKELSKELEGSYTRVSNNLNTKPADNIEVNIYSQRWRYIKSTGNWSASGSIEGIAKLHFVENTWLSGC